MATLRVSEDENAQPKPHEAGEPEGCIRGALDLAQVAIDVR